MTRSHLTYHRRGVRHADGTVETTEALELSVIESDYSDEGEPPPARGIVNTTGTEVESPRRDTLPPIAKCAPRLTLVRRTA
jgi:hypothetical protein